MARILIIEDDSRLREVLTEMLEREGYEVITAGNGKEGLELYNELPVDMVITDILMPEKDGVETISDLKRNFQDVKIIAISGGGLVSGADYLESVRSMLNIRHVFSKPFSTGELLLAVKELIG